MIKDPLLRQKEIRLTNKRKELVDEKLQIEAVLKSIGLSHNAVRYCSHKIDDKSLLLRERSVKRKMDIDIEMQKINKELAKINEKHEEDYQIGISKILREVFSESHWAEIKEEAKRRKDINYTPQRVSFSISDCVEVREKMYAYRELAKDQMDKMIEFRIMLTGMIETGCEQFGNAEFLKFISPLNKMIIPVNELRKIKIKHLL